MNNNLKTTLKAWPVIAGATIGICYLTKIVAGRFGIDLPDQQSVEFVRQWILHAFDSTSNFLTCARLLATVLVIMPVIEEFVFRYLLFMLPARGAKRLLSPSDSRQTNDEPGDKHPHLKIRIFEYSLVFLSAALFSAAHYIEQSFPDSAFIALFFLGLAQCWLYRKTGRIWCAMLNHGLFNLTNLVLLFLIPD